MPTPQEQLQAMQDQIYQSMVEHQIVVQALRAQCLVSAVFILVLGLLSFFMWRRSVCVEQLLVDREKQHSIELSERDARRANEAIDLQRQHSLELDSITRTQWREFVELVLRKPGS